MEELIKLDSYPIRGLVRRLLQDKTTRKNILFASDSYAGYGAGYRDDSQMTEDVLLGFDSCDIQPRVYKAAAEQTERTRKRAEVFTPAWIVNQMNNHCDTEWFGRPDVFNHQDGQKWTVNTEPIEFPEEKDWKQYVDSRRLEITCGEAPYIVSRYDTSTGEIIPIEKRIGILDRKLRIVNENAADEAEWFKWAFRAFQSVYGYEYQGDNLLIARMNLLYTLADYIDAKWNRQATRKELEKFLNVICWNFWQMDGMKDTPPYGIPDDDNIQLSLFEDDEETEDNAIIYCKIYDWRKDISKLFKGQKKRGKGMKFDFVIGNPPYNDEQGIGEQKNFAKPVYHTFIDAAYAISQKVELIHPARFLFNAGATPKEWNEKMLSDPHIKILTYEPDSREIFGSNVSITGGVVISYRDGQKEYGAINVFSPFSELNTILNKTTSVYPDRRFDEIIYIQTRFDLEQLYTDHPEYKANIGSNGKDSRLERNIFEKIDCFNVEPSAADDIKIIGIEARKRVWKYIKRNYIDLTHENLFSYKVIMSTSNGAAGTLGKIAVPICGEPLISKPGEGYTRTFLGIGAFSTEDKAVNCAKYIKTKFCRCMLGILKATQLMNKDVWHMIPLQDFSVESDIDWTQPIAAIDQQLYKKYGLTPDEIKFIETHVKEME